ncbi:MAG: hypothetical protein EA402_13315 [Planctomycetota bacterium]|nr:MAG: hypothetical protein EA402_13315 [Planctomycetota bacterium]
MDSDELAQRVKAQQPGWEEAWEQLCPLLLERTRAVLSRDFHSRHAPGGLATMDDIIQDLWLRWNEKAHDGSLLVNWDRGCALAYLTGRATRRETQRRAIAYTTGGHPKAKQGLSMEDFADPRASTDGDEDEDGVDLANYDGPWHFAPLGASGPTKPHLMAGLQLLGTLEWHEPEATTVRKHMPDFLHPCGPQWWQQAEQAWDQAREALAEELSCLRQALAESSTGFGTRTHKRLQRQLLRCFACLRFAPIKATTVERLTANTRNTVDQHISRYRKALPTLLCELHSLQAQVKLSAEVL